MIGEEQHFFEVKKGGNPISSLLIDLGGDLWVCYKTFDFLSIGWKKDKFSGFDPSSPPPPNWGITEFLPHVIPTHIYVIRCQTDPIDPIGPILVSTKQSKRI